MVAKGNEQDDVLSYYQLQISSDPETYDITRSPETANNHYGSTTNLSDESKKKTYDKSSNIADNKRTLESTNATYWDLLSNNRAYRFYFISSLVTYIGEWFTYVACLTFIAEVVPGSYTAVSMLILIRLLPSILCSMFGGTLADGYDRRLSMITLDCISGFTAIFFLLALATKSLTLLYCLVFVQATTSGMYEPVKFAIIPMLVDNEEDMKRATTLTTIAWSVMAAFGASIGGVFVSLFGMTSCFLFDASTFFISALLMWQVGGTWNASKQVQDDENITISYLWQKSVSMTCDGISYLKSSFFGPLVFIKASGSIMYGAGDILNVAFSECNGMDKCDDSIRLGVLFSCVGIGCIIGPLISNRFTDMKNPKTLQISCIIAYGVMASGFVGLGYFPFFSARCFFTMIRSSGAAVMWTDSSILIQKFSSDDMLGRVSAVDYGFATLSEGTSAVLASMLHDRFGISAQGVSYFISIIGLSMVVIWSKFHLNEGGAASSTVNDKSPQDLERESNELKRMIESENEKINQIP